MTSPEAVVAALLEYGLEDGSSNASRLKKWLSSNDFGAALTAALHKQPEDKSYPYVDWDTARYSWNCPSCKARATVACSLPGKGFKDSKATFRCANCGKQWAHKEFSTARKAAHTANLRNQ